MLSKHPAECSEVVFACPHCPFKSVNAGLFSAHSDKHRRESSDIEASIKIDVGKQDKDSSALDDSSLPPKKRKFGRRRRGMMAPPSPSLLSEKKASKVEEEEDSLHAIPTDLGGTTIPAGQEVRQPATARQGKNFFTSSS